MNRDGDGEEPTTDRPAGGEDNVIAFPGARIKPVEDRADAQEDQAAGDETEAAATEVAAEADEPTPESETAAEVGGEEDDGGMTLDAFERAVRSAVRDKLGDGGPEQPQGADELVAQVFSALTGKDAKTALSEVRQRLSEPLRPDDRGDESEVIDLGAVREARQRASTESAQRIGGALKDTFNKFLANLADRQGFSGEITLDAAFFRQHGASLLGNLFQGLAAALMQPRPEDQRAGGRPGAAPSDEAPKSPSDAVEETAAEPDGDDGDEASAADQAADADAPKPEPAEPKPEKKSVQVKLDLGSILSGLFRRRETPPPEPKDE